MRKEIDKAVETFHRIAFGTNKPALQTITDKQLVSFVTVLTELLVARYKNNWYPENPTRGSGYRCLRMNGQCMDPTVAESLLKSNIAMSLAQRTMELTIWVDPGVVSIRIGEEGSIGTEDLNDRPFYCSEDEAYASRSPSPIGRKQLPATPPKDMAVQCSNSPPVNPQPRVFPVVAHRNINLPSMPARSGQLDARAAMYSNMTHNSPEYMPSGHIPALHPSYSRPKALFPQDIHGNQVYYQDGMVAAHQPRPVRMPRNMMRKGNYMDIPAQA